jgi:hypothetical protein
MKITQLKLLTSMVAMPLLAVSLQASTTYVFTGNDFDLIHGTPNPTTSDALGMSLTFNSPLAANLGFGLQTPASWSMTDGVDVLTSATPGITFQGFNLSTDGSGNIFNWQIQVNGPNGTELMASNSSGGSICCSPSTAFYDVSLTLDGTGSNFAVNNVTRGSWLVATAPEPGSFLFLFGGLAAVWGIRRRSFLSVDGITRHQERS